jgi:hypothetical protein
LGTASGDYESCPASWPTPGAIAVHFRVIGLDLCRLIVGAENLCQQAIFMNHAPGAVMSLDRELILCRSNTRLRS